MMTTEQGLKWFWIGRCALALLRFVYGEYVLCAQLSASCA